VIPFLEGIGRRAFVLYVICAAVYAVMGIAAAAAGAPRPEIVERHGSVPLVNVTQRLGNETYALAVQYVQTIGGVQLVSPVAVAQALQYAVKAVVAIPSLLVDAVRALAAGSPLEVPLTAAAAAAGSLLQACAWLWLVGRFVSRLLGG
jgi:hypothetical protein